MRIRNHYLALIFTACCMPSLVSSSTALDLNLPSIGEPADKVLSPKEEIALGKQFYKQARVAFDLVETPELTEYLTAIGSRLVNRNAFANQQFTFFLVKNREINAFAVPGGYIGINTGLFQATQTESQLASVLAHEIAHITQRHIARFYAKQGNNTLATVALIFAGLAASQSDPQAAQAAITAGIANSQQNQIDFTRQHEHEADRVAVDLMDNADFDVNGLAEFFAILAKQNSINGKEQFPFLRTHPLTISRISEAQNRINQIKSKSAWGSTHDDQSYYLVKAQLSVLNHANLTNLIHRLSLPSRRVDGNINHFTLAYAHFKNNTPAKASHYLQKLPRSLQNNKLVQLLNAQVNYALGNSRDAFAQFKSLSQTFPGQYSTHFYYAQALIQSHRLSDAAELLNNYLRYTQLNNASAHKELARIYKLMEQPAQSHFSLANHYLALDEPKLVENHLNRVIKMATPNSRLQLKAIALLAKNQESRAKNK